MNFNFRKIALLILSLTPISSISFAAKNRLITAEAEQALAFSESMSDKFNPIVRNRFELDALDRDAINSLIPPFTGTASIDAMFDNFSTQHPNLSADEVRVRFESVILDLQQKGILHVDSAVGSGPTSI